MRARSWRWLRLRVHQLLALPPQTCALLDAKGVVHCFHTPQTRIGMKLHPPEWT